MTDSVCRTAAQKLPTNFTTLQPGNVTIGGASPGYWVACTGSHSPPGCPTSSTTDPVCGDGFNTSICRYLYDAYIDVALPVFRAMRAAGPTEGFCGPSESALSTSQDTHNFFLQRCAERGLLTYWDAIGTSSPPCLRRCIALPAPPSVLISCYARADRAVLFCQVCTCTVGLGASSPKRPLLILPAPDSWSPVTQGAMR